MPRNESKRYDKNEVVGDARSGLESKAGNIKANLETLKYLEGEGMVKRQKVAIRDDMGYIVVGLGGVGCQKCEAVKKQLYRDCEEVDVKNHVRFLFVDTDKNAINKYNSNEQVFISCAAGAAEALADPDSSTFMKWCHPKLNKTIAANQGNYTWNSDGANRIRQVGRIKLAIADNRNLIKSKIISAVRDMNNSGSNNFRVIVLAGIAGGTGSGTITDIPYIIRNAVDTAPGFNISSSQFVVEGYIFLPAACGEENDSTAKKIGNRNAYAALKEIDYFMNLYGQNKADPSALYEFCDIKSNKNIFDLCTLIDGVNIGGGIISGRVSEVTSSVVAHSVVNSMISVDGNDSAITKTNEQFFGSVSFLSNLTATSSAKVEGANYHDFPKEANYRFLATGYSEAVIPVDLLKVYLMKKIYDEVYKSYSKAFTITHEAAREFVETAGLDRKGIETLENTGAPYNRLPDKAEEAITDLLKLHGPYYMLELIRAVVDKAIPEVYDDIDRMIGLKAKEKKINLKTRLNDYKKLLNEQHSHDFMVYTVFIEELKNILDEEGQILTNSERRKKAFEEIFVWTPIDLNDDGMTAANMAIKNYLDDLIDKDKINTLANNFKNMLASPKKRKEWKWLHKDAADDTMDAASVIREFIENYINTAEEATIEDYLIKFYSGKSELGSKDTNSEERKNALDLAARKIIDHFEQEASPLIKTANATDRNFAEQGYHKYIIVPECAGGIKDAIINQGLLEKKNVYSGQAKDRIVCFSMYVGLPPYVFEWTREAEKNYEEELKNGAIGLHMEQNEKNGLNYWVSFPNLVPERRLKDANDFHAGSRDNLEYIKTKELIEKAKKFGLAYKSPLDNDTVKPTECNFRIFKRFIDTPDLLKTIRLPGGQTMLVKDGLVEKVIEDVKIYITDQIAQFPDKSINITNLVNELDSGAKFNYDGRPESFFEEKEDIRSNSLASNPISLGENTKLTPEAIREYEDDMDPRILRKQWHKKCCLELSVKVMERLEKYLDDLKDHQDKRRRFVERQTNFVTHLSSGEFLIRDTEECKWFIKDETNFRELLSYGNDIPAARSFNLYAAYLEYANLDDKIYDSVVRAYSEWYSEGKRLPIINKNKKKYSAEIETLLANTDSKTPFPMGKRTVMDERMPNSGWINKHDAGNPITSDELYTFYNNIKSLLYVEDEYKPHDEDESAPQSVSAGTWTCACGTTVSGNFCTECGTKKPAEGWTCSECGNVNKGNFCSNCGEKKPADKWDCTCGAKGITSGFCGECGAKRP